MKATNTFSRVFLLATLIAACFATAAYSDSFVNESVMNTLKDFQFGQTVATTDKAAPETEAVIEGDSFVGAYAMDTLKDFQFGVGVPSANSDKAVATATEEAYTGDSFVSADTVKQLDGFVFFKSKPVAEAKLTNADTSY